MDSVTGTIAKLKIYNDHSDWQQLRVLQILITSDAVSVAEVGESRTAEANDACAPQDWRQSLKGAVRLISLLTWFHLKDISSSMMIKSTGRT